MSSMHRSFLRWDRWALLALIVGLALVSLTRVNPPGVQRASATLSGSPTIDPTKVTVDPPATGAKVHVFVAPTALGNADPDTRVKAENVTREIFSPELAFNPSTGTHLNLAGAGGDVIRLHARNGSETASELIGFVPNPADTARPDYDRALVTITYPNAQGQFQVNGAAGSLSDASFPISAFLRIDGGSATTTQSLTANPGQTVNANPFVFSIAATPGARAILRLTDNFGNITELHWQVGAGVAPRASDYYPSGYASSSQATSERTGEVPTAGLGVLLPGLEFTHSEILYHLRGPVMGLVIQAFHRTGISYDGPLGGSWDWLLDSRLRISGADAHWYTGDGRIEVFTNRTFVAAENSYLYTSPSGIFNRLTFPRVQNADYYLTSRSGLRLVFHGGSGLLKRLEDAYGQNPQNPGNRVEIVRNDDLDPVEIRDEVGRRIVLHWFEDSRRLAEIQDMGGRRIIFEYDSSGRLREFRRADGSATTYGYSGSTPRIETITDAAGSVILQNSYSASGEIADQRDAFCLENGGSYQFLRISSPQSAPREVEVTDPAGAIVLYGFTDTNTQGALEAAPKFTRWYSREGDRGSASGFPGTADPLYWEELYHYGSELLIEKFERRAEGGFSTEHETYSYAPVLDGDPRKKGRILTRTEAGDGNDPPHVWSWAYSGDSYWPTKTVDPLGNETEYEYNPQGRMIRTSQVVTSQGNPSTPSHNIVAKAAYDARGRVTAIWTPNRISTHGENSEPSVEYQYSPSGIAAEFLGAEILQDSTGSSLTAIETAYEYDLFGRVVAQTEPNGSVWETEFDDADRVLVSREPPVARTLPGATGLMQAEVQYVFIEDRLTEIRRKYETADGSGSPWPWIVKSMEYGPHGVLIAEERDATASGARTRTESSYDGRGDMIEAREFGLDAQGQATYTSTRFAHDARGLLLRREEEPEYGASQSSTDDIVTWYAYDLAGRACEVHSPGNGGAITIAYDDYGQRVSVTSPETPLGVGHEGTPQGIPPTSRTGRIRMAWQYDIAGRMVREDQLTAEGSGDNWLIAAAERIDYDEAGRPIRQHTALVRDPTDPVVSTEWATDSVDLHPDGQVHRSYSAQNGLGTYDQMELDDFDRVSMFTSVTGDEFIRVYQTGTGLLEKRQYRPYDEVLQGRFRTYQESYVHDALGRVIESRSHGDILANPLPEVTGGRVAYDGLGRAVRTARINFNTLEESDVSTSEHDLRGFVLRTTSGCACSGAEVTSYIYDLWGRLSTKRHETADPYSADRVHKFQYDGLGRRTSVDLPERTAGVPRTNTFTYLPGDHELATATDAIGVVKGFTYNALGQLLEVNVLASPPSHVAGPERLAYRYGLPAGTKFLISSEPLIASTFSTSISADAQTVVRREFNTGGFLTRERTQVVRDCVAEVEMEFIYDTSSERLRTETHFPTANGSKIRRTFRPDAMVRETQIERQGPSGAAWYTLTKNQYLGTKAQKSEVYEPNPAAGTSTVHTSRTYAFDSKGSPTQLTVLDAAAATLLSDAATYDWQGRMVSHRQSGSGSSALWSHMKYGDGGRLLDAVHGSASSSIDWAQVSATTHGAEFVRHSMTYNDFGELDRVIQWFESADLLRDFRYERDLAGMITGVTQGEHTFEQIYRTFSINAGQNHEKILEQSYAVDDNGSVTSVDLYHWKQNEDFCGGGGSAELESAEINQSRVLDSWGRVVEVAKTRVRPDGPDPDTDPDAHDCYGLPLEEIETYLVKRRYDAFGREVYYEVLGEDAEPREVLHAYEDGEIVSSARLNSCSAGGAPDGRVAERHFDGTRRASGDLSSGRGLEGGSGSSRLGGGHLGGGGGGRDEEWKPEDFKPCGYSEWVRLHGHEFCLLRTVGPLEGPYPSGSLIEEIFTTHAGLMGQHVLSNRDFNPDGTPRGLGGDVQHPFEYGNTFISRECAPWGGIVRDGYEYHQYAIELASGAGFETSLVSSSGVVEETTIFGTQGMQSVLLLGASESAFLGQTGFGFFFLDNACPYWVLAAVSQLRQQEEELRESIEEADAKASVYGSAGITEEKLAELLGSGSREFNAACTLMSMVMQELASLCFDLSAVLSRLSELLELCPGLQEYEGEAGDLAQESTSLQAEAMGIAATGSALAMAGASMPDSSGSPHVGGSKKPKLFFTERANRKQLIESARRGSSGSPQFDKAKDGKPAHWHSADRSGNRLKGSKNNHWLKRGMGKVARGAGKAGRALNKAVSPVWMFIEMNLQMAFPPPYEPGGGTPIA